MNNFRLIKKENRMRVKVELELEVTTDYTEVSGATKENFQEHVEIMLRHLFISESVGDLDYICVINKIEFPDLINK
jgi:hypothetical protein